MILDRSFESVVLCALVLELSLNLVVLEANSNHFLHDANDSGEIAKRH